jgi:uncharacterized RDD family membrane protein YckC
MAFAGFWIRFAALLLDGLIVSIPTAMLSAMLGGGGAFSVGSGARPGASFGANIASTVVGVLYYGLLEGGPTGQTLGKRICSIRVVDATTGLPGIGYPRGIGRYFARWLSSIPLGLGYFWMLWDDKNQTWHDKLARTLVVKT